MRRPGCCTDPKGTTVRILVFVLSVIAATVIETGAILLIVLTAPAHLGWLIILPSIAIGLIVYGATVLGSVSAYWDVRSSSDGRKHFRLWLGIIGVIATVVYSVVAPAPFWLPIIFIVAAALLDLVGISVGRAVLRREQAQRPIDVSWNPITGAVIARKCITVGITFVAFLVVGLALFLVFARDDPDRLSLLGSVFEFAFIAAAFACIIVTIPLNRQLRDPVGRDFGRIRNVAKVVVRNKNIVLDADDQVAAAKYAVIISVTLSFTLAYISLLYVGLAIQLLASLSVGDTYSLFVLIFLVVILFVLFPLQIVRIRRARRYAREHADKLPNAGSASQRSDTIGAGSFAQEEGDR
jgi:hypothetical protein